MNNMKAERTLTAELIAAAQNVYDKLASETATVTIFDQERLGDALRSQSLSTQQPMGEPVAWRWRSPNFQDGWWQLTDVEPTNQQSHLEFQPLYALHPNQESGE